MITRDELRPCKRCGGIRLREAPERVCPCRAGSCAPCGRTFRQLEARESIKPSRFYLLEWQGGGAGQAARVRAVRELRRAVHRDTVQGGPSAGCAVCMAYRDAGRWRSCAHRWPAADREGAGAVDHRPRRAGGRDGRVYLPVAPAHMFGARHCGSDPRWAAAQGAEARRDVGGRAARMERAEGDLGLPVVQRPCLRSYNNSSRD
jgi:hypothetical protein